MLLDLICSPKCPQSLFDISAEETKDDIFGLERDMRRNLKLLVLYIFKEFISI
jgi:hypothetical protein